MRQKPLVKAYNKSWDDSSLLLYLPFDVLLGSMFRKFNKSDGCHHISMLWHKLMHNWTIWCELLNILASDGIKHDPNVTRILGGANTVIQDCIGLILFVTLTTPLSSHLPPPSRHLFFLCCQYDGNNVFWQNLIKLNILSMNIMKIGFCCISWQFWSIHSTRNKFPLKVLLEIIQVPHWL